MSNEHMAIYLNDHLAGSTAALELLELLEKEHAGTATGRFVAELREEIISDQRELRALMKRLRVAESTSRKAAAWLTELITELKLWLEDRPRGAFRLFEVLEGVSVGIEGKRLLWSALAVLAADVPELQGTDYARLEQRAGEQRQRVEAVRLDTGRTAFAAKR